MRRVIVPALLALLATPAFAAEAPKTDEQKTLYTVGHIMSRQISYFSLTPEEFELVKQGLTDGVTDKAPLVDVEAYRKSAQDLAAARRDAQGAKLAIAAEAFIEKAAKEKGAVKTASGMVYQSLTEGTGATPTEADKVKVNYRGTLIDGREFDSTALRGKPADLPVNKIIKCWTEGLQKMKQGGKARFVCPPQIAYGDAAAGIVPANATLAFEVELLEVTKQPIAHGEGQMPAISPAHGK